MSQFDTSLLPPIDGKGKTGEHDATNDEATAESEFRARESSGEASGKPGSWSEIESSPEFKAALHDRNAALFVHAVENGWSSSDLQDFVNAGTFRAPFARIEAALKWMRSLPASMSYEACAFVIHLWRRYESASKALIALREANMRRINYERIGTRHMPIFVTDEMSLGSKDPLPWEVLERRMFFSVTRLMLDIGGGELLALLPQIIIPDLGCAELRVLFVHLPDPHQIDRL